MMTHKAPLTRLISAMIMTGGLGIAFQIQADDSNQGLYSANELIDAKVYTSDSQEEPVAEVEDILLDNAMTLQAIVIAPDELLHLDEKQYVINKDNFSVDTLEGDSLSDIEYVVYLGMDKADISNQPEYTETWWNQSRERAQEAWDKTAEGAKSAWETTRDATSSVLKSAGEALQNAADKAAN
uniref:PRC-barrel domain containing protein n=1 Tax=Halomonas sp. TaxID=1486246 RepID=UPI00262A0B92|nr:PRC-barrel domain containing protein [Halomonas sp.]